MTNEEIKNMAEKHWQYTEQILLKQIELTHYLYVQAMIHGFKHGQDDKIKEDK
jgi:hypothetical protein